MKTKATIIVVGAGVIGCSIAWSLSKRRFRVVLLEEKQEPLKGISAAGFGSLTPFSDPFYSGEARDFAAESVEIYRSGWISELTQISGQNVTFNDNGLLQLCTNDEELAAAKNQAANLAKSHFKAELLTSDETRSMEPHLTGKFIGSLWVNEPWLDRSEYYKALSKTLSLNPTISQKYDTKVIKIAAEKAFVRVSTANGNELECDGVVVCNGLHIDQIHGVPSLPLRWIRGDAVAMHTKDGKPLLRRHIYLHGGFITPRADSEMLLGATYEVESLPSENSRRHRDRIELAQFQKLIDSNQLILPALANCEVSNVWRNWRPAPQDDTPILGPLKHDNRIVIANGFIGLGLTLAPVVGERIAEYFSDSPPRFPPSFSPERSALGGEIK